MFLVNYFTVTLVTLVIKIVCLLVTIAYYTLAERKIMASVQRRLGPNVVGFWGLLQPVSDGLKLFGKELVIPTHANSRIFIFAPIGVLLCAFLGWGVIPFCLFDYSTEMTTAAIWESLVGMSPWAPLTPPQQLERRQYDHRSQAAWEQWCRFPVRKPKLPGVVAVVYVEMCCTLTFIGNPYLHGRLRLFEYLSCAGERY